MENMEHVDSLAEVVTDNVDIIPTDKTVSNSGLKTGLIATGAAAGIVLLWELGVKKGLRWCKNKLAARKEKTEKKTEAIEDNPIEIDGKPVKNK